MKRYEPIRKFIHLTDKRNTDLSVTNLVGLTIEKRYIPSVANVIGTDLSKYKVIKQGQFACSLMQVSRDGKMPVAMYKGEPSIMSPAYPIFEVNDENELMPEYLHMYLSRPEFDREAVFRAVGGVRGSLDWEDLLDMKMPIPSIEEQRKIVAEYQAVEQRIENNNRLIKALEDTAQAIYHHTFVENIDPENLPKGWRWGTIAEFCKKMTSGGTPDRSENLYWNKCDYRWLKTGEVHNNVVLDTEEYISQAGLNNSSAKIIPKGSITVAMYCANGVTGGQVAYLNCETTTNQACCNIICNSKLDASYLFFYFMNRQEEIKRLANCAAQANLSQKIIAEQNILLFNDDKIKRRFEVILNNLIVLYQEIDILNRIQNILISKLS